MADGWGHWNLLDCSCLMTAVARRLCLFFFSLSLSGGLYIRPPLHRSKAALEPRVQCVRRDSLEESSATLRRGGFLFHGWLCVDGVVHSYKLSSICTQVSIRRTEGTQWRQERQRTLRERNLGRRINREG